MLIWVSCASWSSALENPPESMILFLYQLAIHMFHEGISLLQEVIKLLKVFQNSPESIDFQ